MLNYAFLSRTVTILNVQSSGGIPDKEIKQAEDKFAESLHLAQMGMFNIQEADVEQISQLMQFAEALLEYHKQCSEILQVSLELETIL